MTPKFDKSISEHDAHRERPRSWPSYPYHSRHTGKRGYTGRVGPETGNKAELARKLYFMHYNLYTDPNGPVFDSETGRKWRRKHLSDHDVDTLEYAHLMNKRGEEEQKRRAYRKKDFEKWPNNDPEWLKRNPPFDYRKDF